MEHNVIQEDRSTNWINRCHFGDCRDTMRAMIADGVKVQTIVTSPPYYGLRDYGHPDQLGLEETPDAYIVALIEVFRAAFDLLADDGTLWLNIGDSYARTGGTDRRVPATAGVGSTRDTIKQRGDRTQRSPTGLKDKDLIGIPWMLAFALRADGWYLRSEVIWAKPNGMPGSQQDRPTSSHESVFLLSKSASYFSDFDAIKTPPRESSLVRLAQDTQSQRGSHRANGGGKTNGAMKAVPGSDKQRGHSRQHAGFNDRWDAMSKEEQQSMPAMMRDVWFVPTSGYDGAHFAVMPKEIAARCILAGSQAGDIVFDPFFGSGTTGQVAQSLGRHFIGCELNRDYELLQRERLRQPGLRLEVA